VKINCVATRFKTSSTDILLGENATEQKIKALSKQGRLKDYRIVHFATHGVVAGEVAKGQAEPGLVMTPPTASGDEEDDGLLTASEVALLELDANWVILSACNTASGDNLGAEALSGLARAFFYAGSRGLLVSHWPVKSVAAVLLIDRTVAAVNSRNAGRAEALRAAMKSIVDGDREAHPSVWAPFFVVGEGAR
jgi:CHAT domain-containing protein